MKSEKKFWVEEYYGTKKKKIQRIHDDDFSYLSNQIRKYKGICLCH